MGVSYLFDIFLEEMMHPHSSYNIIYYIMHSLKFHVLRKKFRRAITKSIIDRAYDQQNKIDKKSYKLHINKYIYTWKRTGKELLLTYEKSKKSNDFHVPPDHILG